MKHYAKKREPVRAAQWTGSMTSDVQDLLGSRATRMNETLLAKQQLELGNGWFADVGDWIVSTSGEDFHVIGDEVFRQRYEEVVDEDPHLKHLKMNKQAQELLDLADRKLSLLGGQPCERCSRKEGNEIIGPLGEECSLIGGYEAILCRACRNAWKVASDESGHWLAYHQASEELELARSVIKAGVSANKPLTGEEIRTVVGSLIEAVIVTERKLFQLAVKWVAAKELTL